MKTRETTVRIIYLLYRYLTKNVACPSAYLYIVYKTRNLWPNIILIQNNSSRVTLASSLNVESISWILCCVFNYYILIISQQLC